MTFQLPVIDDLGELTDLVTRRGDLFLPAGSAGTPNQAAMRRYRERFDVGQDSRSSTGVEFRS